MIKRYIVFTLALAFSSTGMAAVCLFTGATQVPANSTFAIGPNLNDFVANNAAIGTAIYAGRDAWDVTDAVDRIGNWNNAYPVDCQLRWMNPFTVIECFIGRSRGVCRKT